MNLVLLIALGILGIAAMLLQWKQQFRFIPWIQLAFGTLGIQWLATQFNPEAQGAFYALIAVLAINILASRVAFFQRKGVRVLIPLLTIFGYYFLFGGETFVFDETRFVIERKFILLAIGIAVLGYEIGALKIGFLRRWISEKEGEVWLNAVLVFFTGFAVLMGFVAAPVLGPLMTGVAFLAASFYRTDDSGRIGISLIALAFLPAIAALANLDVSLLDGDVLGGIFAGAFGMYLVQSLWRVEKPNGAFLVLAYLFAFAIAFGFGMGSKAFENMGGVDAYIGALVGMIVAQAILGRQLSGISVLAPALVVGVLLPNLLKNPEEMAAEENIIVMNSTDANGNKVEGPKVLPLTDVLGSYSILADSSQVVFSLGKNGVTKGKFKKVAGTMTLAEDPTQSALKVVLEMKDFTTFNGMRDESLRGSDYFNVDKFPKMTYQVKGFADKGNDEYEATGDFTMLGVTKPIKVTLQRVEVGDRLILIGSGTIDRTEFGMAPSAAEGNVVSFNYQVELVQK